MPRDHQEEAGGGWKMSNLKAEWTGLISILHCIRIIYQVTQGGEISKPEGTKMRKEVQSLTQKHLVTLAL